MVSVMPLNLVLVGPETSKPGKPVESNCPTLGESSVAALVIASAIATTSIAAAADITYFVNQTIAGGSVDGTITTDGFTGPLFTGDIVNLNLITSVGGDTTTLMSGVNGGLVFFVGGGLSATPDGTQLQFNFGGQGTFANFFTNPTTGPAALCAPIWSMRTAGGTNCNGTSGTINSVQSALVVRLLRLT
jgi:hypothetical protein